MEEFRSLRRVSLGYRISRLHWLKSSLVDRWLGHTGVSQGQVPYIAELFDEDELSQDELAGRIKVNRAATARALKALEESGHVKRRENPDNRRQKLVSLTAKSWAMKPEFLDVIARMNLALFAGFKDEERTTMLNLLDRVMVNIEQELATGEKD
ncbi:MarR family winged helix-turn-helix transcriptional regulator [Desulfovibrio ferrophilus]|uniref:Putative Transcriptional regulator, MarR family n=1 Tax=Desulfovibrio ferrophilus TaxID=241368 RepID=A0A2Z6B280_9BACT|nr:MarR family transcriptional regulator [Desulfovibrio ferrophilus]BBD09612.1 putative Transcriptional regulator, MarR family [Desulfovibrio ferrophilus]